MPCREIPQNSIVIAGEVRGLPKFGGRPMTRDERSAALLCGMDDRGRQARARLTRRDIAAPMTKLGSDAAAFPCTPLKLRLVGSATVAILAIAASLAPQLSGGAATATVSVFTVTNSLAFGPGSLAAATTTGRTAIRELPERR